MIIQSHRNENRHTRLYPHPHTCLMTYSPRSATSTNALNSSGTIAFSAHHATSVTTLLALHGHLNTPTCFESSASSTTSAYICTDILPPSDMSHFQKRYAEGGEGDPPCYSLVNA